MTKDEIERNFTYHKPFGDQALRYEQLRSIGKVLATEIQRDCPESREQSLAFTHLEQAIMWANAAIARNESRSATVDSMTPGGAKTSQPRRDE